MSETIELACGDKLRFDSRAEAEASAATIEHQRGTKLKAYKCQECRLWHLSST
jgi:hypothetical protein